MSTTCLKAVGGVSKGMFPVEHFCSKNASFCVSRISWRSLDCYEDEVKHILWILADLRQWCLSIYMYMLYVCYIYICYIYMLHYKRPFGASLTNIYMLVRGAPNGLL